MAELLMDAAEVARRVDALAQAIAPDIDDDSVLVCLLTGGIWFAADLTRALWRLGRDPLFDCLWLTSYGDARRGGAVVELSGLQRPVRDRKVVILDEVMDSGASLASAKAICLREGAAEVRIAVFARKPWGTPREVDPDYVGWEAPGRYLVGYGMDDAGRSRGFCGIAAVDRKVNDPCH